MTYTTEHHSKKGKFNFLLWDNQRVAYAILCFMASAILSCAENNGECTSFGVAFVGALGAGLNGAVSLIGCAVGYAFFFGFDESAIYIASAVLIYTISFLFQYSPVYRNRVFSIINVSVVLGISSAFNSISSVRGDSPYFFDVMLEVLCGSVMTYVYQSLLCLLNSDEKEYNSQKFICWIVFVSSFLISCMDIYLMGKLSIGKMLYFVLVMLGGRLQKVHYMSLALVIFGLSASCFGGDTIMYMYLSIVYVMICVFFDVKTKPASIIILLSAALMVSFVEGSFLWQSLTEMGIAILLVLIIPDAWVIMLSSNKWREVENGEKSHVLRCDSGAKVSELMSNISETFRDMSSECVYTDTMDVFQSAVERVCNSCKYNDICWGNHGIQIFEMLYELKNRVDQRGKLRVEDFPSWFQEYCVANQLMLMEINYELRNRAEKYLYDTNYNAMMVKISDVFNLLSGVSIRFSERNDISDETCTEIQKKLTMYLRQRRLNCIVFISWIRKGVLRIELHGADVKRMISSLRFLDEISELLNMRLRAMRKADEKDTIILYNAEPYAVSVGVATKKKKGEHVCGDNFSYFKTEQGKFYIILSDGLGAGEHAEQQSKDVISMLEHFIINDLELLEALRLCDLIVSMKNNEQWNCATIDLFSLDLYTGEAEIYKIGAAPSYWNRKDQLCLIEENMLCAGNLIGEPFHVYRECFCMDSDDVLVLTSDGVMIEEQDVLRKVIFDEFDSMKLLARTILLNSQMKEVFDDDMTVITVKMERRL